MARKRGSQQADNSDSPATQRRLARQASQSNGAMFKGALVVAIFGIAAYIQLNRDVYLVTDSGEIKTDYDYVVVGGGTAGAIIAARLAEARHSVLLLEAGISENHNDVHIPGACPLLQRSERDWQYQTVPQEHACQAMEGHRSNWPRGKVLGGCSSINYVAWVRCDPSDYDRWEASGAKGWGWNNIEPYFVALEDYEGQWASEKRGVGGPVTISDARADDKATDTWLAAAKEAGYDIIDYNGESMLGFGRTQFNVDKGTRESTARAFLRPAMNKPDSTLTVRTECLVTRVLFHNKNAYGVEFIRTNKDMKKVETVRARKEVILSAGAVGSPQILQLSGVGAAADLTPLGIEVVAEVPGVGENLQDHIMFPISTFIKKPYAITQAKAESISSIATYMLKGKGILSTSGLTSLAFLKTGLRPDVEGPDLQFHFVPGYYRPVDLKNINYNFSMFRMDCEGECEAVAALPSLLHSKSRGTIKIATADPFDHPLIDPKYLTDEVDVDTLLYGVRVVEKLLKTNAMQELVDEERTQPDRGMIPCNHHPAGSDEFWKCCIRHYTLTIYHPIGTCKMGPDSDPMAVVDSELRVRGVTNLRVVDASVMPDLPSGNTNAPTMAIAARAADLILGKVKTE